jgi:hypothetical protein
MNTTTRRALAEALPNLIYLAAVAGFMVIMSNRDWLARQWGRLEAFRGRGPDGAELEVSAFMRRVSDYEHGGPL